MDRFEEIRASKLRHKPAVQVIMDSARHFRASPGDLYDESYRSLESFVYAALQDAYTTGRMSNDSWK